MVLPILLQIIILHQLESNKTLKDEVVNKRIHVLFHVPYKKKALQLIELQRFYSFY